MALISLDVLDMWVRTSDYHTVEDTWLAGLWPHAPLPRSIRLLPYVVSGGAWPWGTMGELLSPWGGPGGTFVILAAFL